MTGKVLNDSIDKAPGGINPNNLEKNGAVVPLALQNKIC